jgi:hypothetical protein
MINNFFSQFLHNSYITLKKKFKKNFTFEYLRPTYRKTNSMVEKKKKKKNN